jgi:bleomycin hydrolase
VSQLLGQSSKGIDSGTREKLHKSFKMDKIRQALVNAISNNDINSLALNRKMINQHDEIFNVMIEAKGITDQKSSGRCWMYAGLNILRPAMLKKHNLSEFEFSQSYLFFLGQTGKM